MPRRFGFALIVVALLTVLVTLVASAEFNGTGTGGTGGTAPGLRNQPGRGVIPVRPLPAAVKETVDSGTGKKLGLSDRSLELDIPAGISGKSLEISIKPQRAPGVGGVKIFQQWDLRAVDPTDRSELHNFSKEITLTSVFHPDDIRGMDWNSLTFVWFDPELESWVPIPTDVDFKTRTLTAKTNHFSIYGTQAASAYAIPGQIMDFQVNLNSGSASYSYPIQLPPGRGGFQPLNLAFNYNSGSVDEMKNKRDIGSMVGLGWSFDLPNVSYNEEKDEYSLVLGGVSGELVQDGTTSRWYTNPYSPTYIEQIDTSGDISWKIQTTNGTTYTFDTERTRWENVCNIQIVYRWDLDSVEDVHGNRIDVTWHQDLLPIGGGAPSGCDTVRAAYPNEIKAVDGSTTLWSALFNYNTASNSTSSLYGTVRKDTPRSDSAPVAYPEPVITETREFDGITIRDGEATPNTIREYVIATATTDDYTIGAQYFAGEHTLTSITVKGIDGGSMESTTFTYSDRENRYFDADQAIQIESQYLTSNPGNPYVFERPYLTRIDNGYDGTIDFTYETRRPIPFSNEWTRQVVTKIVANPDSTSATDGVPIVTEYKYIDESGYDAAPEYVITGSSFNAEYRGFRLVKVIASDGSYSLNRFLTAGTAFSVNHPITGSGTEDAEELKGKAYESEVFSADGIRLSRSVTNWDVSTSGLPTGVTRSYVADSGSQTFNAAGTTEVSKSWTYLGYDGYNNVNLERRLGDFSITSDDVTIHRDFVYNTSSGNWIVSTVKNERVYAGDVQTDPEDNPDNIADSKIGETRYSYDGQAYGSNPTLGSVTRIGTYSSADQVHETIHTYDTYGNIATTTDPSSEITSFAYDTVLHAYVTSTTLPAVGLGSSMTVQTTYDLTASSGDPAGILRGLVESQTDENGDSTSFEYDEFGRIKKVIRPGDDSTNPTLRFDYLSWGTNGQQRVEIEAKIGTPAVYSKRQEFFDGLGRVIQALEPGTTTGKKTVLQTVRYDAQGRVVSSFTPWEVADTVNAYQSPYNATNKTSTTENAGAGADDGSGNYSWTSLTSLAASDDTRSVSASSGTITRNTGWLEPDHVDENSGGISWSDQSKLYRTATEDGVHGLAKDIPATGGYGNNLYSYFNGTYVPTDSTIKGLELKTRRYNSPGGVRDNYITLTGPGTSGSDSSFTVWNGGSPRIDTYGGPTATWGGSWSPSDINADNNQFRVKIQPLNQSAQISSAYVDYVKLRVYYDDKSVSNGLVAQGFGFDIPVGARIDGVEVLIERSAESSSPTVRDETVQLLRDGVPIGENKADTALDWPVTDTVKTYPSTGGSADTWGRPWTPEEINSPDFGVRLRVRTDSLDDARVDHIQVRIHYTPAKVGPKEVYASSSVFDALGRVIEQTGVDGSTATRSYAPATVTGEVWAETVTDPSGNVTRNYTDAFGRLVRIEELNASAQVYRETRYTYDASGNLTRVEVDPIIETTLPTVVTELTYDWLGRKLTHRDPDIGFWQYTYDANGNLKTQTDARGVEITFTYDELNRETLRRCTANCPGATAPVTLATFGYDDTTSSNNGKGRRTSASNGDGSVTDAYFYDDRGRVTKQTRTLQGDSYVTSFTYDPADRLLTTTLPSGEVVTQSYDNRSLPESLTSSVLGGVVATSTYNVLDLPTSVGLGNGTSNTRQYFGLEYIPNVNDPTANFGQLYQIESTDGTTPFVDLRLGWDPNGNLDQRRDNIAAEIENFQYDFLNRLTEQEILPADPSLIGYWSFDTDTISGNDVADLTGRFEATIGTQGSVLPTVVTGKYGEALDFDGDDFVKVINDGNTPFSGTNSWSIAMWVNYDNTASNYYPQFSLGSGSNGLTLHGTNGRINGGDGLGNTFDIYNFYQQDLRGAGWKHTVLTYDGLKFRAYVNGVYQAGVDWTHGIGTSTDDIFMGIFWGPDYQGLIDEVRFYDTALSAAEVTALHAAVPSLTTRSYTYDGHDNITSKPGQGTYTTGIAAGTTPTVSSPFVEESASTDHYWSFNSGDITGDSIADLVGTADGTLKPNASTGPQVVTGLFGDALDFDGTTQDYVTLPHTVLNDATDVTISLWVKTSSSEGAASLISAATSVDDNAFQFLMYDGTDMTLHTDEWTVGSWPRWSSVPDIYDDQWHHLVIIRNDTSNLAELYVDGVSQGSIAATMDAIDVDPGGLVLGQDQDTVGGGFSSVEAYAGLLDDLRIYERVLTSGEVTALYYSADSGPRPHLVTGTTTSGADAYTYDANGNTTARPGQDLVWNAQNLLQEVKNSSTSATIESYLYDADGQRAVKVAGSGDVTHYVGGQYQVEKPATGTDSATTTYFHGGQITATATTPWPDSADTTHYVTSPIATQRLGQAVAVSGDTIVAGAIGDTTNGTDSGAVFVFELTSSGWTETKLTASDGAAGDGFGWSVAIDGDTVAVGAPYDDDNGSNSGTVYIYTRTSGVWGGETKIQPSDAGTNDQFGYSVSVSGDTLAIGAKLDDGIAVDAGSVYVFTRTAGVWGGQTNLQPAALGASDEFGYSVSVNEAAGILVAGAPKHDNSSLSNSGKAWVYTGSGTSWSIDGTLEPASGVEAGEQFGYSVDTDGQWIIVGGPWDTQNGASAGAAYIFAPASAGGWEQKQKVIGADTGASDYFGISVALDNSLAVAGAYAYDGPGGTNDGAVYVLQLQGSTWAIGAATSAESPAYTDQFGIAVAVDGAWVVGGSNQDDNGASNAGSVYAMRHINASVQYLHPDHLGSPVAATDIFGNVVGTQSFYPFGEVRSGTGIFDTERGFTGQIFDAGTGLGFYNARYYDSALGKFISPDSIVPNPQNPGLFNRFAYVSNNPLKYTDPTGHDSCSYAGENDSCQTVEEGSNEISGEVTDYAEVRLELEDYYLDVYEYYALYRDAEYADEVLFDGFEAAVASKQSSLEDVAHPLDGPVDSSLWSIQAAPGPGVVESGPRSNSSNNNDQKVSNDGGVFNRCWSCFRKAAGGGALVLTGTAVAAGGTALAVVVVGLECSTGVGCILAVHSAGTIAGGTWLAGGALARVGAARINEAYWDD